MLKRVTKITLLCLIFVNLIGNAKVWADAGQQFANNMRTQTSSKNISGKVTAKSGEALPGVTILVKGTTNGSITDVDGNYTITNISEGDVLIFSFVGMETKELTVAGQSTMNVVLEESAIGLNEVVAIGYGTLKKDDLTGSVAVIKPENLNSLPVPSVGDAIQGQASGVQVISSGVPGSDPTFSIRGIGTINSSSPLYVIDGVPVSSGLNQLNMNDIESIQVLKDASATAIYGSRGANGVVIITTQRGKSEKGEMKFNVYSGIQQATSMVDMLDASEFAQLHNEMMENAGQSKDPDNADPESLGEGTDWLNALFQTARMNNYSFSYAKNNGNNNCYVSANIFNQDGIVTNTNFTRYVVQLNTDTKVTPRIKFGNSLTLEHDIKTSGDYNIQDAMLALPTQPIFRSEGVYSGPIDQAIWDGDITNPIGRATVVENSTKGYNILGSAYGEFDILDNLKFRSAVGIQANIWTNRTWSPAYEWDASINEESYLYQQASNSITWLWDNTLTYDQIFADVHHVIAMIGSSAQENSYEYMNGSVNEFQSDATQQLVNGNTILTLNGNQSEWSLLSYMARVNYTYNDKYLFTATIRRDGSSRFGDGNKWGWFPSASFAWKISKEEFFKSIECMNDLKLRVGYGATGNQEIGNYAFASELETVQYTLNGTAVSAVVPNVMPNSNVKWESQQQSNIGIDAAFFKNRISLTVDAYLKNTEGMLVPMSVPVTTGYSDTDVSYTNAGSMRNRGLEFSVQSKNMTKEFKWNTNFNLSLNQNKILNLDENSSISTGSIGLNYNLALLKAGHPVNAFYGFVTDGIFQNQDEVDSHAVQVEGDDEYNRTAPGDIRFKDLNNDGVIDDDDRTFIGNPSPVCIFGLTNSFAYKGFDLSIFLQGVYGNDILNANRIWSEAMSIAENQTVATLNRWTGEGTSTTIPRAIYNDPNNNERPSDRYIEDGSYLRIKNVTLGYNLPSALLSNVNISGIRVYISAQNLFTFTNYQGFDPEVSQNGIDNNVYPVARTVSCGLSVNF